MTCFKIHGFGPARVTQTVKSRTCRTGKLDNLLNLALILSLLFRIFVPIQLYVLLHSLFQYFPQIISLNYIPMIHSLFHLLILNLQCLLILLILLIFLLPQTANSPCGRMAESCWPRMSRSGLVPVITADWLWAAAMVGSYLPRLCAPSAAVKAACRRKVPLPLASERVRDDNHVGGGSYSYANASIGSFCAALKAG